MKKVGIITILDNDNYGNRLQNYAVQTILKKKGCDTVTLKNIPQFNEKNKFFLRGIKYFLKGKHKSQNEQRSQRFQEFNKNIVYSKKIVTPFSKIKNEFDFFITGSDQVWNPTFGRLRDVDLLYFAQNSQKISFSASFGISNLPKEYRPKVKKNLADFKAISVREKAGQNIVEELTNRNDVAVLVDPTMLLTPKEWDEVSKRPEQLQTNRYILNYFLGELSEKRKQEIDKIAQENDCEVIHILDKNSPFYQTGPSEFLYLEKNAFLICTDSFHACVFAILYNKPFIVFDREDKNISMNSRIETLIHKFNLKNREFKGTITKENLDYDNTQVYEILEKERKKADLFLTNALEMDKHEKK